MKLNRLHDLDEELYPSNSQHRVEIERYFEGRVFRRFTAKEKEFLQAIDLFLVAFSNRSGSTLLTEVLNQAGFGVPPKAEVFNGDAVLRVCRDEQLESFSDYLLNGVRGWHRDQLVGFKIGPRQLFWMAEVGFLSLFRSVKVINTGRRDLVAQAVSFYIAAETGQWHSKMSARKPREGLDYCGRSILERLRIIHADQQLIEYFLNIHGLPSHCVIYEDLLARPGDEIVAIAQFLGERSPAVGSVDLDGVGIQRQFSSMNTDFSDRFRSEFGLGGILSDSILGDGAS